MAALPLHPHPHPCCSPLLLLPVHQLVMLVMLVVAVAVGRVVLPQHLLQRKRKRRSQRQRRCWGVPSGWVHWGGTMMGAARISSSGCVRHYLTTAMNPPA